MTKKVFLDSDVYNLHFIGICGVAMASVAAELKRDGFFITGSDSGNYPPMSTFLERENIEVQEGFNKSHVPDDALIVIGNAVSRGNIELETALNKRLKIISLPELISRRYLNGKLNIVVTGTHGKTTITSMLTHILLSAGKKPGWMIGGIPLDFPSPCEKGKDDIFVIEGDEYDAVYYDKRPKFLHYRPYYAIISSIEFDHADIYRDIDEIEDAFTKFVRLLPEKGLLVANGDDERVCKIAEQALCRVIRYGSKRNCDWRFENFGKTNGKDLNGDFLTPGGERGFAQTKLFGNHNLMNSLAATIVACELGVSLPDSLRSLCKFQGTSRRLELVFDKKNIKLYDDFAHHPTAIKSTLQALKNRYPNHRIWAIVELRSNTMVRSIISDELIAALSFADKVILGAVHRKDRIPLLQRINPAKIVFELKKRKVEGVAIRNVDKIADLIDKCVKPYDVIVIMSNGGIDDVKNKIIKILSSR